MCGRIGDLGVLRFHQARHRLCRKLSAAAVVVVQHFERYWGSWLGVERFRRVSNNVVEGLLILSVNRAPPKLVAAIGDAAYNKGRHGHGQNPTTNASQHANLTLDGVFWSGSGIMVTHSPQCTRYARKRLLRNRTEFTLWPG